MNHVAESSDDGLLGLLRKTGSQSISDLTRATGVTPTAVRQRLVRLMAEGLVTREVNRIKRGRPSHRYALTDKGRRQSGSNFADLAVALWQEVRAIEQPEVRRGLLERIAKTMAGMYRSQVSGRSTAERMDSVSQLLAERDVPFEVDRSGDLPVLSAVGCPYPDLAERDRGICALERMMFSELVGESLRLSECRLDGDECCRFEPKSGALKEEATAVQ